jgi:hypothetical protein
MRRLHCGPCRVKGKQAISSSQNFLLQSGESRLIKRMITWSKRKKRRWREWKSKEGMTGERKQESWIWRTDGWAALKGKEKENGKVGGHSSDEWESPWDCQLDWGQSVVSSQANWSHFRRRSPRPPFRLQWGYSQEKAVYTCTKFWRH